MLRLNKNQLAQFILDLLLADIQDFQGEMNQADDIALMVIKRE